MFCQIVFGKRKTQESKTKLQTQSPLSFDVLVLFHSFRDHKFIMGPSLWYVDVHHYLNVRHLVGCLVVPLQYTLKAILFSISILYNA